MTLKGAILRMFILMILLPPPSEPASSDSFPWAGDPDRATGAASAGVHRDSYGALRDNFMLPDTVPNTVRTQVSSKLETGMIAPGGTVSASGVAQGNVGPTQSGPGAIGLFTPNSPGNAAAYQAQISGGLTASPIVDGSGVNTRTVVPMSTPSGIPNYHDTKVGTGGFARANALIYTGSAASGVNGNEQSHSPDASLPLRSDAGVSDAFPHQTRSRLAATNVRSVPVKRLTTASQLRKNPLQPIGQLTGTISYADGSRVLLGSSGAATIDSNRKNLTFDNGRQLPMPSVAHSIRQVAQRNQVRL
ncbi:MAG TPA: hypothetical protein V6C89_16615 [Drouetiella sp.]|jgi:hypothetical protein